MAETAETFVVTLTTRTAAGEELWWAAKVFPSGRVNAWARKRQRAEAIGADRAEKVKEFYREPGTVEGTVAVVAVDPAG